jgi:hypothetical protein
MAKKVATPQPINQKQLLWTVLILPAQTLKAPTGSKERKKKGSLLKT